VRLRRERPPGAGVSLALADELTAALAHANDPAPAERARGGLIERHTLEPRAAALLRGDEHRAGDPRGAAVARAPGRDADRRSVRAHREGRRGRAIHLVALPRGAAKEAERAIAERDHHAAGRLDRQRERGAIDDAVREHDRDDALLAGRERARGDRLRERGRAGDDGGDLLVEIDRAKRYQQGGRVGEAAIERALEAARDEAREALRHVGSERGDRRRLLREHREHGRHQGAALERVLPGEGLVEHDAERPHVARRADALLAARLLG